MTVPHYLCKGFALRKIFDNDVGGWLIPMWAGVKPARTVYRCYSNPWKGVEKETAFTWE